jgi:pimeloyl-ACP methyl ester carboxylesterase
MRRHADDGAISFEDAGAGPPVVLLHAFPLSGAMWAEPQKALAASHRVIAVDARGFGGSEGTSGPLTMDSIADDAAAVMDHLGLATAVIVGCSMGGYAAFAFARRHAAKLRGLVLVDTKAAPDTDEARAGRASLAQKVREQGAQAAAEAMLPKLLGPRTHRDRPTVVARVRQWILEARPEAIASALDGLAAREDSRPSLARIVVPCLVVRGEEDGISTDADTVEMQRGIAASRAVTIPAAGHLVSLEAAEPFVAALGDFLSRLG